MSNNLKNASGLVKQFINAENIIKHIHLNDVIDTKIMSRAYEKCIGLNVNIISFFYIFTP